MQVGACAMASAISQNTTRPAKSCKLKGSSLAPVSQRLCITVPKTNV